MRPWRLVVLAVVVLALGGYIWFVERHQPTTEERQERADKVFPEFKQDKVRRVELTTARGRFELVKEKDDWKLLAPLADDANSGAVSSLLATLSNLKADRVLEAENLKLADYGLESPALAVAVEEESGARWALELGAELPLGNTRAARVPGGGKVYVISKWLASDVDRDLSAWRSTELARVMAADVASVAIRGPAGRVALAHAGGVWTLTEPFADLADRDRAEGLIGDVNAARIKEFLDQPGDLAGLGLDPAAAEVTVVRKEGAPVQLFFGSQREKDGAKEIACKRGERVFWVEATPLGRLEAPPVEWRSKRLVALDTWSADTLDVEAGGAGAALKREEGVWKAGGVEVDFDAVSRRLRALADLEVQRFDAPKPEGAALGTVKAVQTGGGIAEATFFAGAGEGEAVAAVPGRSGFLVVDDVRAREVLADPAALAAPKPTPTPEPSPVPEASPTNE
ncbi:MAG: DUF4340 domain-containing protein [Acidobacteriota bacterium]